jgi:hypothetical protein
MSVSRGDQEFSRASGIAPRHWGIPVHPGMVAAYAATSAIDTTSLKHAMSKVITAWRTLEA